MLKKIERFFEFEKFGTNFKVETYAGITTFLTMAYILGVNTGILSAAGMPAKSVFFATAISSAFASILMGILANYPVALAPGMGVNAFFTFTVVMKYGYTWQEALAMVFISGLLFILISATGLRKKIINEIPKDLKQAIGAGIGFFIAFIGLVKAGIITSNPATLVGLGNIKHPTVILALFGLFLTIFLMSKNINSAIFIGLVTTGIVGVILGKFGIANMPSLPQSIMSADIELYTFGAFLEGMKSIFTRVDVITVIFTFLFVDFFDTAGTLLAVCNKMGITKEDGTIEGVERALYADSIGTVFGAALGTSTVTSFVESSSGVAVGGRTGFTAIVVGILFLLSTLFSPLLSVVGSIPVAEGVFLEPVVAPALICVGILMATQLSSIDWHDFTSAASGFVAIIMMILTYSIADGIAAGFITYVLTMVASKRSKEITPIIWVLSIVFLIHFIV